MRNVAAAPAAFNPAASSARGMRWGSGSSGRAEGFGRTGSTRMWCRKHGRLASVCDRIHRDGSSASGTNGRQEEMFFSKVTWGAGGWTYSHTEPSIPPWLILQFLLTLKGVFGNLYAHVGINPDGCYGEELPLCLKFNYVQVPRQPETPCITVAFVWSLSASLFRSEKKETAPWPLLCMPGFMCQPSYRGCAHAALLI